MTEILRPVPMAEQRVVKPVQESLNEWKIRRPRGGSRWRKMLEMAPKTSEESIKRLLQVMVIPLFNPDSLIRKRRIFTASTHV